jgi:hypothetical protein
MQPDRPDDGQASYTTAVTARHQRREREPPFGAPRDQIPPVLAVAHNWLLWPALRSAHRAALTLGCGVD